jgi:hypothetical protein
VPPGADRTEVLWNLQHVGATDAADAEAKLRTAFETAADRASTELLEFSITGIAPDAGES